MPCCNKARILHQSNKTSFFCFHRKRILIPVPYFSRALSVRTVASIWWFFTLIMVSSYTANLAAFLTVETPKVLIENVKDLAANKEGVVYGAKRTGSTRNFFSVENLFANSNFKFFKQNQYFISTDLHRSNV